MMINLFSKYSGGMMRSLLALLLIFSLLAPGLSAVQAEETATTKAVSWYQANHPSPSSWEGLPALWSAGEDLNKAPWETNQAWRETDPGFGSDTDGNEHIHYIFRLLSVGKNPANIWEGRNLFAELAAQQGENYVFGNLGKHIWAMVALDVGKEIGVDVGVWDGERREKALQYLLSQQNADGSFGNLSELDFTGWTLTALSAYRGVQETDQAISRAVEYIRSKQQDNGGFGGEWGAENANTIAAVLSGLVAVGEDILSPAAGWVKNDNTIRDALLKYQQDNGSFWWQEGIGGAVEKSTAQALLALVDLERGESTWHRMGKEIRFEEETPDSVTIRIEGPSHTILPDTTVQVVGGTGFAEILIDNAESLGYTVEYTDGEWGKFIDSINNITGEPNWMVSPWQEAGYFAGDSFVFSGNGSTREGEITVSATEVSSGQDVTVTVTADDTPLAGATVIYYTQAEMTSPTVAGTTDANGKLTFSIEDAGTYYLAADKTNTSEWPDPDNGLLRTKAEQVTVWKNWDMNGVPVSSSKTWRVEFNLPVHPDSINMQNFFVRDGQGQVVEIPEPVLEGDRTVKINPPALDYQAGGQYTLYITGNVRAASGRYLKAPVQITFTIED